MRFKDIIEKERAADEALEALKREIVQKVESAEPEGVTPVGNGEVACVSVNLSTIMNNNSFAAKTYIQQAQAEGVRRRLAGATRTYEVIDRIREMVETGNVVYAKGDNMKLNKASINALRSFVEEVDAE